MHDKTLEEQLADLRKTYASRYARVEILKLKTANRDESLIKKKQSELIDLEAKISDIENALLEK